MSAFKPLDICKYNKANRNVTPDSKYWQSFEAPTIVKEFGAIDYIDFNSIEPYNFAVTCSVRVQIYNPITKLLVKNLSRFQDTAYGGTFRRDGRLLVAGDVQGFVRLFDISSKNILRLFKGHESAVHRVQFTNDLLQVISFSDDKTVKLWDITTEKVLHSYNEHGDYIRAGAVSPGSANIIVSGGYDGKLNIYDNRMKEVCFSAEQSSPVESLLFLSSGGLLLSSGGNDIYVWDVFSRCRLLTKITEHHKTVTCLRAASDGKRFLSGSLDRHVKIYDVSTFRAVHALNFPNSILSLGIAPNDQSLVVGMVDGLISMQNKDLEKRIKQPINVRKRTLQVTSTRIDHTIENIEDPKMAKYNHFLRKYEYVKCLNIVMTAFFTKKKPEITVGVMQELIRRKGLHRALGGRNHGFIGKVLNFLIHYISDYRFMRTLIEVMHVLFDVCAYQSDLLIGDLGPKFTQLNNLIQKEKQHTLEMLELKGSFEFLIDCAGSQNCYKKFYIEKNCETLTQSADAIKTSTVVL